MNKVVFAGVFEGIFDEAAVKNFEIIVPEESCILYCNGNERRILPGQIAIIPPQVIKSVKGKIVRVQIEQALLPFKQPTVVDDDGAGGIAFAARQAAEYCKKGGERLGLAEALGELIVAYITAFSGGVSLSPVVESVLFEIQRNISTPSFSLEDSIKKLPLNYDYVRKLFKKETGVTPHEYLLNSRMQFARELIESGIGNRYSNYSVAQIAEACGFSEPLYFSRVFKKYYGVSPSAYAAGSRN